MAYKAEVVTDSLSEAGIRLVTFVITFPRMVLAEFNTHRMFSRNSASSRAIPFMKILRMVWKDPFIPVYWGKNKPGMQAAEPISPFKQKIAKFLWLRARDFAIIFAWLLYKLGVHKQTVNRLLEPFMWHTVIVTMTESRNFFALRASPEAQPEIRIIAEMMKKEMDRSSPQLLKIGEWHLPFLQKDEVEWAKANPEEAKLAMSARCARVSYLTHDTNKVDLEKDLALARRLSESGHMSPFEHIATPATYLGWSGNFFGWMQFRKELLNESDFSQVEKR